MTLSSPSSRARHRLAGRKQFVFTRADGWMARTELTNPLPVLDQSSNLGSLVLGPVHRTARA